jgi:hypothetical protein
MKKSSLHLLLLTFLAFACSQDETPIVDDIQSNLILNENIYEPTTANTFVRTLDGTTYRKFILERTEIGHTYQLVCELSYPLDVLVIDGSYDLTNPHSQNNSISVKYTHYADAYPTIPIIFNTGSVTIADLGNNKYKLVFSSLYGFTPIEILPPNGQENFLSGYCEATYTIIE